MTIMEAKYSQEPASQYAWFDCKMVKRRANGTGRRKHTTAAICATNVTESDNEKSNHLIAELCPILVRQNVYV